MHRQSRRQMSSGLSMIYGSDWKIYDRLIMQRPKLKVEFWTKMHGAFNFVEN